MPLCTYYLQGEPGESADQPNAFRLPSSASPITLSQFVGVFPLLVSDPTAKLHFRFRSVDKSSGYIWLDVSNFDSEIPLWKGNIYAKVLRTDSLHACQRYSRLKRKVNSESGMEGAKAASKIRESRDCTENSSINNRTYNGEKQLPNHQQQASPSSTESISQQNTIQFESTVSPDHADSNFVTVEDLGFAQSKNISSLSKTTESIKANPVPVAVPAPVQLDRAELAAKREAQVEENVQRALEDKQERDTMLRKESDEMDAARTHHDKNLTEWAFDASKKKRNVRTLLSTMHKVLWVNNKWKEIGLGDVLQPKQVKMKYRKAMLVVHPDRLAGEAAETRFIAKRVFEAINEQYQEFLKAESPDN